MLSQRKTLIAAACGTAALLAAIAAMADGGGWGGWHGRGGPNRLIIFEIFDLNKDGKVTQDEIDQARKDQLRQVRQQPGRRAQPGGVPGAVDGRDAPSDGAPVPGQRSPTATASITVEEFTARFADLVRDRDRNGDGVLTVDELRPHGRGPHRGPEPRARPWTRPRPDDDGQ